MLVVIDMQNQIRDENSQSFISDSPALITRIAKRLQQARAEGEYILLQRDIPIDCKDTLMKNKKRYRSFLNCNRYRMKSNKNITLVSHLKFSWKSRSNFSMIK